MADNDLKPSDTFVHRHLGPTDADLADMLRLLGYASLEELTDATVPADIRLPRPLALGQERSEHEALGELHQLAQHNLVMRSCIGQGYHDTIVPGVIQRNILENPGWYTAYTPYQSEISQGRLEALLMFQTMVSDLTRLPLANASLLDESTAAAEAMAMCHAAGGAEKPAFFIADDCHPQTIAVVAGRARALGVKTIVAAPANFDWSVAPLCGALFQYPTTDGRVVDYTEMVKQVHASGALAVVAADPLALVLLKTPGEMGADIAVGVTQRFGVPMGFGGPHAGYLATKPEYARKMPGRIVGVSKDARGKVAYRLAIQTREQHIRREKATSNICTAQALPAILSVMYAIYHGPEGLKKIARRVHALTDALATGLRRLGYHTGAEPFFDTLRVKFPRGDSAGVLKTAAEKGYNLRRFDDTALGVALDETTTAEDVQRILEAFGATAKSRIDNPQSKIPLPRATDFLTHPVFHRCHAEHEMLRFIKRLESRDITLCQSMIPLGSCTMKLNGTSLMQPISWPRFARMHPFAPPEQTRGYARLFAQLGDWLKEITGLSAVSLQPNSGASGEYTGLLVIRAYHESRSQAHRNVCLIPVSAHGTNPASAALAGFRVVAVACDEMGNIDLADLRARAAEHADHLAALMLTYPSTHGVFEENVRRVCEIIHAAGGQVYMDGANMNAQVGLTSPGVIGADVCHLNLHKTFCIPHGGGGPGMGPIAVAAHLAPFLPGHPFLSSHHQSQIENPKSIAPVSAAPFGSAGILPISYLYIALMGEPGLRRATQVAILSANYMAKRLENDYPVLFRGRGGRVAHEFIIDCRHFEKSAGVKVEDIAKRLMDYGFHAPTMSWPVPGTLMIEPTESESKAELDRLCEALLLIRQEIRDIEQGRGDRHDNPLKNAPHPPDVVTADQWTHPYPRKQAAYPAPWLHEFKYWPPVARIDNPYGDRHLVCTCPPMETRSSQP